MDLLLLRSRDLTGTVAIYITCLTTTIIGIRKRYISRERSSSKNFKTNLIFLKLTCFNKVTSPLTRSRVLLWLIQVSTWKRFSIWYPLSMKLIRILIWLSLRISMTSQSIQFRELKKKNLCFTTNYKIWKLNTMNSNKLMKRSLVRITI